MCGFKMACVVVPGAKYILVKLAQLHAIQKPTLVFENDCHLPTLRCLRF